ncbi:MAG: tRNA pseudouridine(38-40) synthase TruA [Clostridia bacterium]|nr:tRNA pseudouridine(38-40) synthase TruA [Clostridia bacterium]
MKYLIRLSFVGTAYCGWQTQKNGPSVQSCVMEALRKIFGSISEFSGCSRTDSGVHALDFCASFSVSSRKPDAPISAQSSCDVPISAQAPYDAPPCDAPISTSAPRNKETSIPLPCDKLISALNANLPKDISVHSAQVVPDDFHARYSVKRKEYLYRIRTSDVRSPFWEERAWHRRGDYDITLLNQAAAEFRGTHDFRSFMAAGSKIDDCTRTVFDARFEQNGENLDFYVSADGFLYNMVRIMVGTLLDVPRRFSPQDVVEILEAKDRSRAGMTAPAHGLYLNRVEY